MTKTRLYKIQRLFMCITLKCFELSHKERNENIHICRASQKPPHIMKSFMQSEMVRLD